MDNKPLTTQQVAALFAVHPATVVRWADDGQLPCFRTPGGHRRFRREDVEALLGRDKQPAASGAA